MKIVFLDEYSVNKTDLGPIKSLGEYVGYQYTAPGQTMERCRDAEVIITNKVVISKEIMRASHNLRLICVAATGMNNIDLEAAQELGIEVRNAVGYSTHSVAEATFAFALALLRHSAYYDRYVKSGAYAQSLTPFHFGATIRQLHGKTWGIIGMGHIGQRVAEIARAFGTKIIYHSTSGQNLEAGFPHRSLDELLQEADIVSIHAPLNQYTLNLIDYVKIAKMKETAILINVARGKIVDEAGLARALNEKKIAGAALDVFESEPIKADNPLLFIENPDKLILAPHTAWASDDALQSLTHAICQNIKNFYKI